VSLKNHPRREIGIGIGPVYARRLKKLNINTVADLIYHFPFRYLDYSLISPISRIQAGETVSVQGEVIKFTNQYTRRGKQIQKVIAADNSGQIEATWFNQPFLKTVFKPGVTVSLSGKIELFGRKKVLISPDYEVIKLGRPAIHTGRLVPVYHETAGVSSKWLRSRIAVLLQNSRFKIEEFLPSKIIQKYELTDLKQAIEQIHFPKSRPQLEKAKTRLAFDELFLLQLISLSRKKVWQQKKLAFHFTIKKTGLKSFTKSLPFKLTNAQQRAIKEILTDLAKNQPMNRLLEGDVGSGKTVVAAAAIVTAWRNGCQSALMAPTEILANQHFLTLSQFLSPLGVKTSLLTGSRQKPKSNFDLLIGTHALIHKRARFKKLGLVIVDEQHRFGVAQRAKLIQQNGQTPHLLTMTATPIPRTIALTAYGDLNLSILDEMPPGRQTTKTWVVPPRKRQPAYQWIKKQIKAHYSQAFIVCPFIEPSETLQTVKAVKTEFANLQTIFPQLRLGLLHGRLKSQEKEDVLEKFQKQKIDILVATPVVEVGLDISNATMMIVEGAERFGLAQLHQLRGRVGRGVKQSYCLLFGAKRTRRLMAMKANHSGIKLAQIDLQLRGPGQIYGLYQHGFSNLKVASFTDWPLIKKTRQAATTVMKNLSAYPLLKEKLKNYKIDRVEPN